MERRQFIRTTLIAGASVVTFNAGCGNDVRPPPEIDAVVDDQGKVSLDLQQTPDLMREDGAVTVRLSGVQAGQPAAILVVQVNPNVFIAVDSACPHQGCPLGYQKTDKQIECPCHSSRFAALPNPMTGQCAGAVLHLPAQSDLRSYAAALVPHSNTLQIDLNPFGALPATATLSLADHPSLQTVGGSLVFTVGCVPFMLVRTDATTVVATSAACTHQGCLVQYNQARNDLECPCHNSVYAVDGTILQKATGNAAPQASLKHYPVDFDGQTLIIHFS
jgi:Rieske Fe-S protein